VEEKGYLALVLHAHLPFVRHPEHEHFLEEDWLYEAITETYLPLITVFDRLMEDNVPFGLTMTLSPTLLAMLADPLLQDRYVRHLERLIELAEKEVWRTRWQPDFHEIARMYLERFNHCRYLFVQRYHKNLIQAFRRYQDEGRIEIMTCGATHGYLPLMEMIPAAARAQIQVAVRHYEIHFGRKPKGFWLPECAYYPGLDQLLKEAGLKYFLLDTHGVLYATPRPRYGVFAPLYCRSGIAAFGRDMESSKQVWSSVEGYPGDYHYREFYRDIGFDLDYDYIQPYIHPDGIRVNTGIKYHRITGQTDDKEPYVRKWALEKAAEHAGNFMFNRERQVEYLRDFLGKKPVVVAPYDAELFGHWWFEGPEWLDFLIRKIAYDQKTVRLTTLGQYLKENPRHQVAAPAGSSWGWKGYHEVWLEGSNDWIYRHLHQASDRMVELANRYPSAEGIQKRALNQAARELLLAQSSDWAFIMKTGTTVPYAVRRTREHVSRFSRIYEDIRGNRLDEQWLRDLEWKDNLFSEIDYRAYGNTAT
jgi:1,4-alpha-glucan branching enzyme